MMKCLNSKTKQSKMFWREPIILFLLVHKCYTCTAQSETSTHISGADLAAVLPEPRAYVPDSQYLNFVYHNHDELTKFLR